MKKQLFKYWPFLLSGLAFLVFLLSFQQLVNTDYNEETAYFQSQFAKKEKQLNDLLNRVEFSNNKLINISSADFSIHTYQNDSLINWNTNKLPIIRFADIHYPSNGVVKLQNGWYYSRFKTHGKYKIALSFLIQHSYKFENEFLRNNFSPDFELPFEASLILEKDQGFPIYDKQKNFLFSIYPKDNQVVSEVQSHFLMLLFLVGIFFLLHGVFKFSFQKSPAKKILLVGGILILQSILLLTNSYVFLDKLSVINPEVYASSIWFPNLFVFVLNSILIFYGIVLISPIFIKIHRLKFAKLAALFLYLLTLFYTFSLSYLYQTLVKDSSIPLEIGKLFKLNYYSFWAAFSMGILFYSYFILVRTVLKNLLLSKWSHAGIISLWLVSGVLYLIIDLFFGSQYIFSALWPLIINGMLLINLLRSSGQISFNYGVILLFLFAAYISIIIHEFQGEKEKQARELYAQQLASDQDISTEVEFSQISSNLKNDKYIQKILSYRRNLGESEFRDYMERKYFNNFWESYEIDYFLFDENLSSIINQNKSQNTSVKYLENVLQKHSKNSEIDANLFYIKDYTSQLSYIGKHQLFTSDSTKSLLLYTTFKTKRIPEKIGFPRLLISNRATTFQTIDDYSIAKYYNGKLVSQNGNFSYPTEDYGLTKNIKYTSGYYDSEDYNHFLYRKNSRDLIVLTKKTDSNFQLFTSFSYLFCFFGLFLLFPILLAYFTNFEQIRLTLAIKIQVILIGVVLLALLFFGLASGKFVSNQYEAYSNLLVKEKINSVLVEVKNKLSEKRNLKIEEDGAYINFILEKFAAVFVTDINLYDKKGYILGTSRPKIFNSGLLSDQINPLAFKELDSNKKSEFIHQESIGELQFLSAYVPLYNQEGNLLAYINLQHFGQQQGFENQIEQFLVAIINVFVLLLAFSIMLSVFVSSWVTSPLKIIQQSFARIQLGKYNKPIEYAAKDEIGALVNDYNKKLEELAYTAQQLAKSERESAWREMAKQVAHEIKNPLTPMKLSLQHFQRIFDPTDPQAKEKLEKVIRSIIEQIDALTLIANEFSNFAKMPKENKEKIDLIPLIEHVITLFNQDNLCEISFINTESEVYLLADKDLLLRVLNNLLKNSIQAIPEGRKGSIKLSLQQSEQGILIQVTDNGKGISEDQYSKIFTPNFTTKSTGTGLGLAMVKQIVELHEGKIWFESEVDIKTSFYILLPKVKL